jgi:hypothetical protein
MYLFAIFIQYVRPVSPRILDAVKVDLYAFFMQGLDLIENIDHTPVIGRVWNIE